MQAGHTSIPARGARGSSGGGEGAKKKTRITTKAPCTHLSFFGGIPSSLVIDPKRKPFSHAFGFGFGETTVSASEPCSVVLIEISTS